MLILHGSLHILVAHGSHDGSQVSGSLQNPGAVVMPPTIEDKIFGKPSFDPGFTKSLRHCGEVTRLGAFRWEKSGPRVVISHNAPVINPNSKYKGGPLTPAFNSLDMVEIIETHQPALWVYGHTHECDDQTIGQTRIISNQLGYPGNLGGFECKDFDGAALPVEVGV